MNTGRVLFYILLVFLVLWLFHYGIPRNKETAVATVSAEGKNSGNALVNFVKNLWSKEAVNIPEKIVINITNTTGE